MSTAAIKSRGVDYTDGSLPIRHLFPGEERPTPAHLTSSSSSFATNNHPTSYQSSFGLGLIDRSSSYNSLQKDIYSTGDYTRSYSGSNHLQTTSTSTAPSTLLPSAGIGTVSSFSSSAALSSTLALSGLAKLVHSQSDNHSYAKNERGDASPAYNPTRGGLDQSNTRDPHNSRPRRSAPTDYRENLSRVKGGAGSLSIDRDIGQGAFQSSLRHITANLNQAEESSPFR